MYMNHINDVSNMDRDGKNMNNMNMSMKNMNMKGMNMKININL
jgi:hypothetical protein